MKLTAEVRAQVLAMKARGWPVKRIAQKLELSDTSVYKVIHPVRSDRVNDTPPQYRDSPHKAAIRQLTGEIGELRDNVNKRLRRHVATGLDIARQQEHIQELERQRKALWQKHKGVTQ
jgi:transposase